VTRTLLVGWFSFEGMGATAGDLLAADVARQWLESADRSVQLATVAPFDGDVTLDTADLDSYDELVFVCGPMGNGPPVADLLHQFAGRRRIGLDVSMLQPLDEWNPFDVLFERDSNRRSLPDLSLLAEHHPVPVIGLIEVEPQSEYGDRARHGDVATVIRQALDRFNAVVIPIDTRLDVNVTGLSTPAQVETMISRCDVVITTRLHGTVLALKHGVPPIVIDPIHGGAKVFQQATLLGWPLRFLPEEVDEDTLADAIATALKPHQKKSARDCAIAACDVLEVARDRFLEEIGS
jgi:hypothetical protein